MGSGASTATTTTATTIVVDNDDDVGEITRQQHIRSIDDIEEKHIVEEAIRFATSDREKFERIIRSVRVALSNDGKKEEKKANMEETLSLVSSSNHLVDIVKEMNLVRTRPKEYARKLEKTLTQYAGKKRRRPGSNVILITTEGKKAVEECIDVLRKMKKSLPPFDEKLNQNMCRACLDHVNDTGPKGLTGHTGSDGSTPFDRLKRYGSYRGTAGENISYGAKSAEEIVMQLMVDDNVPDRGHRTNMLNPAFRVVGVAVGKHSTYGTMCCVTHAQGYGPKLTERGEMRSETATLSKDMLDFFDSTPVLGMKEKAVAFVNSAPNADAVVLKYSPIDARIVLHVGSAKKWMDLKWSS